jgi:thiol-disulfide isomerase/thioredoxin
MTSRSETEAGTRRAPRRIALIACAALLGAAVGLAAVYGMGRFGRNAGSTTCSAGMAAAQRIAPLVHGEVAAISTADEPRRIPELAFKDATGATKTLAEWHGRAVLFNLWATWCVPCRKEMPALEALQARFGGPRFDVVAVNIDTRNPEKPKAWLKEVGINQLAYYADPSAKVFQDLKLADRAFGMPTTLLVDANGCEVGTLAGPAEWASDDAVKLIGALIGS